MLIAVSIHELRAMSDEEVIRRHDEAAKNTLVGTAFYLDELRRRGDERHAEKMLKLTEDLAVYTGEIRWLTRVVTAATVIAILIAAIGVLK